MSDRMEQSPAPAKARPALVIVAGLVIVSIYLPWIEFTQTAGSQSRNGVEGVSGGYFFLLMVILLIVSGLTTAFLARVTSVIVSLAGLAFAVVEFGRVSTFVGDWNHTSNAAEASIGVGLWLLLLSFAGALGVSTWWWVQAKTEPPAPVVPSLAA